MIIDSGLLKSTDQTNHTLLASSVLVGARVTSEVLWWRRTDATGLPGTVPDDLAVDSARHAVVQLGVQLWQDVLLVHGRLGDVTHSGRLDDVPDDELLDRLVLRNASGAVGATHGLDVPAVVLATPSVTTFLGLQRRKARISDRR